MNIVLLHGFTGSPESWAPVLEPLAALGPKALALPGHGGPPPRQSFDDAVDSMLALVPTGTEDLAGYSLGGRLALGMAMREPGRFRRITLIGAHPGLDDEDRSARSKLDSLWADQIERDFPAFLDAWARQPVFATQDEAQRRQQATIRSAHAPAALAAAMRQMSLATMPDYRSRLGELKARVQLVTGSRDAKFSELASAMHNSLSNSERHVVEGVGHNVLVEAPESLTALMTAFHARPG